MAAPSGPEDDDPTKEARAYNSNIYLMVTMPYALLGLIAGLVYRGLHRSRQPLGQTSAITSSLSCHTNSSGTIDATERADP